jgi:hypothetical protein
LEGTVSGSSVFREDQISRYVKQIDTKLFHNDTFSDTNLIANDFFQAQPIKDADVFLLRMILHDYPDELCVKILRHLRSAAKPTTQLLIVDSIMFHTCADPVIHEIPGAEMFDPSTPLLKNLGAASLTSHLMDMDVGSHFPRQKEKLSKNAFHR